MQGAPPGLIIYLRTVDLGKSCHSKVCKYQIITPYFRLRTSLIFPKNSVLVKSLLILNLPCHNQENIGEILLVKSRNVLCLNLNSIVQVDTWYIMQIKQDDIQTLDGSDIYGSTTVTISFIEKTNKYNIEGNNTWVGDITR